MRLDLRGLKKVNDPGSAVISGVRIANRINAFSKVWRKEIKSNYAILERDFRGLLSHEDPTIPFNQLLDKLMAVAYVNNIEILKDDELKWDLEPILARLIEESMEVTDLDLDWEPIVNEVVDHMHEIVRLVRVLNRPPQNAKGPSNLEEVPHA